MRRLAPLSDSRIAQKLLQRLSPCGNYCITVIISRQEVFLCYSICESMDIFKRIEGWLLAIRAWIREIHDALQNNPSSEHIGGGIEVGDDLPRQPIRTIVSFDDKTIRRTQSEGDRQHSTQDSIKKATWAAVVAAAIYALISLLQWRQMLRQSRIASDTLGQSIESFRIDERAWIELEPIEPAKLFSPATKFIPRTSFVYELYPKNFGKTIARDVAMKASVSGGSEDFGDSADQIERWQDKFLLNQFTEMGTGKPVVVPPSPIPKVLAPGVSTPVPYVVHAQGPQYFDNGHAMYDYIVGRVDYTDQFSIPHWIKFCFFVRNPRGELTSCQYGNDEDRNPETPKKAN
jgi:hypothetical protein